MSNLLPGFVATDAEATASMSLDQLTNRAIKLLRDNEPQEGYYLAFSGGKDSCVIKELARMAGVKFDAHYASTTIDPPELVRFIKQHHPDVTWMFSKHGNMMHRVATRASPPPTRMARWCCAEYKETGGHGRVKIFGVRAAESAARKRRWSEVSMDTDKWKAVCPIVHWTDGRVWEFIRKHNVAYCSLYDEGWNRLGCVGCPLNPASQKREFERWPAFERNWKKAIIANWEINHKKLREDGKERFHAAFRSGEDLWQWWLTANKPDYMRGDCQSMLLWSNEPGTTDEEAP